MQTRENPSLVANYRTIAITDRTLNTLVLELGNECQTVVTLLNQLQLPNLNPNQQATILAELLAATIHLQSQCDDDLQTRIADQLETLPDNDE
jgi:hypothetical protein